MPAAPQSLILRSSTPNKPTARSDLRDDAHSQGSPLTAYRVSGYGLGTRLSRYTGQGMKQSTQRFINRPFIRTLVAVLAFVLIASCLDMFWKKSSQRSRGAELTRAVQKPEKGDRVVTAHFMVGSSRCSLKLRFLTKLSTARQHVPLRGGGLAGKLQIGRGNGHVSLPLTCCVGAPLGVRCKNMLTCCDSSEMLSPSTSDRNPGNSRRHVQRTAYARLGNR